MDAEIGILLRRGIRLHVIDAPLNAVFAWARVIELGVREFAPLPGSLGITNLAPIVFVLLVVSAWPRTTVHVLEHFLSSWLASKHLTAVSLYPTISLFVRTRPRVLRCSCWSMCASQIFAESKFLGKCTFGSRGYVE